jgi:phosphoglucosamine mutase
MILEEVCEKVVVTPVGDVAVAEGIRKYKADFGGEPSGTFIFPDIHMYPDGVATAAKAAEMIAEGLFYSVLEEIHTYPVKRVKIPCDEEKKEKVIDVIKQNLDEEYYDIDGIKVEMKQGWILIRPSGTEPFMRVTAEAYTPKELEEIVSLGTKWVKDALK